MRERQIGNNSRLHTCDHGAPEQDAGDLQGILQIYRDACHAAAEKPASFWNKQHSTILSKLQKPGSTSWDKPALLWVPTSVVVLLCLFLFVENSKAPTPDFAAGADQDLLVAVERALNRNYPDALAPAALLSREVDRVSKGSEHEANSE